MSNTKNPEESPAQLDKENVKGNVNVSISAPSSMILVKELQRRLTRRNELLDIIRKAYHRDVLTVREYLLQLQLKERKVEKNEKNECDNDDEGEDWMDSITNLADFDLRTIPSIDLRQMKSIYSSENEYDEKETNGDDTQYNCKREVVTDAEFHSGTGPRTGFYLYAPEECELSIVPCHECGGRLEITHHESARYMKLLSTCNGLKEREEHLVKLLEEAEEGVDSEKEQSLKQESIALDLQHRLENEIYELKEEVANYDALQIKYNEQTVEVERLHQIRIAKEEVDVTLAETRAELNSQMSTCDKMTRDNVEMQTKNKLLKEQCLAGEAMLDTYTMEIKTLQENYKEAQETLSTLEELEQQWKDEIKMCKAEITRRDEIIQSSKARHLRLQQTLDQTRDKSNATITELQQSQSQSNATIQKLHSQLNDKTTSSQKYREQIKGEMNTLQENERLRMEEDRAVKEDLNRRLVMLLNLTTSYIRGLYDQCLAQEQILRREDRACEFENEHEHGKGQQKAKTTPMRNLQRNQSHRHKNHSTNVSDGEKCKAWDVVKAKLQQVKKNAVHLSWENLLSNDNDRRMIFGNLNNRTQRNLAYISDLLRAKSSKYATQLQKEKEREFAQMEAVCQSHQVQIDTMKEREISLEEEIHDAHTSLMETKCQLEEALLTIKRMTMEKTQRDEAMHQLQERIQHSSKKCRELEHDLSTAQQALHDVTVSLREREGELRDRQETMEQFEKLLQNTAARLATRVEDERYRLETNECVGIQVEPSVNEGWTQVDFVLPRDSYKDGNNGGAR